ncbi:hypothetical protein JTE90_013014 [Oedothorax gibbosus]|uniref:Uncharacterized protein n=1 Tax=Oedothorax gibbosus TaxID=931172 RepID=A0AAV6UNP1_9ARAC|nr:hypothetical protein JTE90_013014 [Oedothorax gibbosus]
MIRLHPIYADKSSLYPAACSKAKQKLMMKTTWREWNEVPHIKFQKRKQKFNGNFHPLFLIPDFLPKRSIRTFHPLHPPPQFGGSKPPKGKNTRLPLGLIILFPLEIEGRLHSRARDNGREDVVPSLMGLEFVLVDLVVGI